MQLQAANLEQCVEDFKKAISLDPDNSDIYHHRGQVCPLLCAFAVAFSVCIKCKNSVPLKCL